MLMIVILLVTVVLLVLSTTKLNLHPFLALLFAAIGFGIVSGMPLSVIAESINEGFGGTLAKIGIVIIAGTIIGTFLDYSGGAFTLADRILKIIGERSVPFAMSIIGYLVSIPVFADSGFVILASLNKALSKRANISLAGSAIALALGLLSTHALVPPTPGPIAAAGILNADLGLVILLGLPISFIALLGGWLFATKYAAKVYIDPNPDISEKEISETMKEAPSAFYAILPIFVPIVLIVLKSISDFPTYPFGQGYFKQLIDFIGNPLIALLIGVLIAFKLPRKFSKDMLSTSGWVGKGLLNAAIIIMITGAGGAFGKVLQNSNIVDVLGSLLSEANLGMWLPFIIAIALKTAQGSSTVAIITTSSILSPLMEPLGFTSSVAIALTVLSIGAGSLVVSHANDSYFWVVTQMSRMDVKTGYKLQTLGSGILGMVGGIAVWIFGLFLI